MIESVSDSKIGLSLVSMTSFNVKKGDGEMGWGRGIDITRKGQGDTAPVNIVTGFHAECGCITATEL